MVVIVGLPFALANDAKVMSKRQYLDSQGSGGGITGNEWYMQSATRAVNQAIGELLLLWLLFPLY